jgi:hypothetical protein
VWTFAGKDSVDDKPKIEGFVGFSVRLSATEDFFGLQGSSTFNIANIPPNDADGRQGPRFAVDLRQTRLKAGFTARGTPLGAIESYIEADFYGPNNAATLRLRHAYVEFQRIRLGQYWSTLADMDASPRTADFDGPTTGILVRSAMVRYSTTTWKGTTPASKGTFFTASLEAPRADTRFSPTSDTLTTPAFQPLPDLVANVRWEKTWGHLQLAGVVRDLRYRDAATNQNHDLFGRGLVFSGAVKTTKAGSQAMFQAIAGKGIQRYLVSLSGFNIEAIPDTVGSSTLIPLATYGGFAAYDHVWNKKYHSTAVIGGTAVPHNTEGLPEPPFRGLYTSVNLFWDGAPNLTLGPEIEYGVRWNADDSSSDALRLTFLAKYGF